MDDKLKSLTEKLYKDGLKKGQNEADELVNKAQNKANKIIEEANAKAKLIIKNAEKDAFDKRKKVESELSMSSKQVITKLKNEITSLLVIKNVKEASDNAFNDISFIQNLIMKIVENWNKNEPNALSLKLELPEKMQSDLTNFIEHNCRNHLEKGMEFSFSSIVDKGFTIGPKDTSYTIEFSDQSFASFFNEYLKPMTRDIVFKEPIN